MAKRRERKSENIDLIWSSECWDYLYYLENEKKLNDHLKHEKHSLKEIYNY